MELEQELDRLYQATPGTFVTERNDLVRRLRHAGRRDEANTVARLPRPTPVAWSINQLHFRATGELAALEVAGAALKAVQEGLGDSEAFAECKREHQHALRRAAGRALELCEENGIPTNVGLRRRLETTLNLLSATPDADPRPGRLSVEVEPLGFDSLSIAASPAPREPSAQASGAADAAEKERVAALRAETALLEQRLPGLEQTAERTRSRHRETEERLEVAMRETETARGDRDEARRAAGDAQLELDEARKDLERRRRRLP